MQKQKPLGVNDPRNEEIIKSIQRMKNDYMDRLLANDAKFQLHDIESFRQKLMRARINDPNYAQIPIPQLSNELVQQQAEYYRNWLESLFRAEAIKYKVEQELKNKEKTLKQKTDDDISVTVLQQYDLATKQRRAEIQEKIKKREK